MKHLLYLLCIVSCFGASAQIPNGDFENWYTDSTGKARLTGWEHIVKNGFFNPSLFGTWQDLASQNGQYALKMSRWYNYTWDAVRQSSAVGFKPGKLTGHYKYTDNNLTMNGRTKDTALLEVYVTKWNSTMSKRDTIGSGTKELSVSATYSLFTCDINYSIAASPDSILIHISPSKFEGNGPGLCADSSLCSFLSVDNLRLEQSTSVQNQSVDYVAVYPNPATTRLFIDLRRAGSATLTVRDVPGKIVERTILSPTVTELNIASWSSGLYFLSVQGSQFNEVIKVQKE